MHDPKTYFYSDSHGYRWDDGIEVELESFREASESFSAHVTVVYRANEADEEYVLLSDGRMNLAAPQTLTSNAKTLGGKRRVQAPEWHDRLLYVAHHSRKQYQEGRSVLRHADEIEVDYDTPASLLPPLVAGSGVSLWYADSSAGKTMLAIAAGLSVVTGHPFLGIRPTRTGTAIYFDWEDNEETFKERVAALCAGAGIPVPHEFLYRSPDRSAGAGEARLRRECEEHGAVLAVFDSVGEMLGGDPSDPVLVIPAVNVMKRIGCPALALHHISAQQAASRDLKDKQKGYGSVYIRSGARLQWYFDRFQEEEADEGVLYAHNTKVNRGKRSKALSWTVEYENGANEHLARLRYSTRSASDYFDRLKEETPASDLSVKDAIPAFLESKHGTAYGYEALLSGVTVLRGRETTLATIRTKVSELVRAGVLVKVDGHNGSPMFGLRSDRHEE